MPAIPVVSLRVDDAAIPAAVGTPARIGSASGSLTQDAPTLVIARGNARNSSGGTDGVLELRIGGTVYAREQAQPPFGSPAYGPLGGVQLATAVLITPGASDEMEFFAGDDANSGEATSCRAHALDLTAFVIDEQRFHEQTANSDTIVSTPTSGFEVVGNELVVMPVRSGTYILLAAAEVVPDAGAAASDLARIRVSQDGVVISGSIHHATLGASGVRRLDCMGYMLATRVTCVEGVETVLAIEADGIQANGNIGYRRVRLHLLEDAAFASLAVLFDLDTAGLTVNAGDGPQSVSGLSATMDPPAASDYLVLGSVQGQFSAWPRIWLRAGSTDYPSDGVANAAVNTGAGTGDDMTLNFACDVIEDVATSTALGMRMEAAAGGAVNLYGADCVRTADGGAGATEGGAIYLLAIRLESVESGGFEDGSFEDAAAATDAASAQRLVATAALTDTAAALDDAHGSALVSARSTGDFAPAVGIGRGTIDS
jgi:hypothetical protein